MSPSPASPDSPRNAVTGPKIAAALDLSWRSNYEFDVFISYSRKDADFARKLDSLLRDYTAPADLDPTCKRLRVFRDEQDLTGVEYKWAIEDQLHKSAKLVIICSPAAQASRYVNDEIQSFQLANQSRDLITENALIPVLVEGLPNNDTTEATRDAAAFPPALCSGDSIPLAADYRRIDLHRQRINRAPYESEWYKLLANVYGTAQAVIEEREKRRQARRRRSLVAVLSFALLVVSGLLIFALISRNAAERSANNERIAREGEAQQRLTAQQKQREAEAAAVAARLAQDGERQQKEEAQRQRNFAVTRQLAAQSELLRTGEPGLIDTSLLLAVESMKRVPLFENHDALRRALELLPAVVVNTGVPNPTAVAFSPDSQSAAVAGADGFARMVDLPSGKLQREFTAASPVFSLVFSPNGHLLAAGCSGSVRVFDSATGQEIAHLDKLGNVFSVAITRDGRFLATGSDDKAARVFRTDTWAQILSVVDPEAVTEVVLSPDGRYLMTKSTQVRIFDLANGKEVPQPEDPFPVEPLALGSNGLYVALDFFRDARLLSAETGKDLGPIAGDMIRAVAFSPDGEAIAACSGMEGRDKTCRIFKASSPPEEVSDLEQQHVVTAIGFSPDDTLLATTSTDGLVRMFEAETGDEVGRIPHQEAGPAILSADSHYIATGVGSKNARIYALSSNEILRIPNERRVTTIAFSEDGRYVAHAGNAQLVEIPRGGEPLAAANLGKAMAVALSRDGEYLAIGGANRPLLVLNVSNGQEVFRADPRGRIQALAFSADGRRLAAGGTGGTALVVEWNTPKEAQELASCGGARLGVVRALTFSRDGRYLAIGTEGRKAHVIKLENCEEFFSVTHDQVVHSVAFSPDGRYFASGSLDNIVSVVDMSTRKKILSLPHSQNIFTIAFSPDGRMVATGGFDRTVRLFDLPGGREVSRVHDADKVRALLFSPDGRYLTTAAGDEGDVVVSRYLLRPKDLIEEACRHLGRNLSKGEWREHLREEPYQKTCPERP
jgi:WD40 repeat protein